MGDEPEDTFTLQEMIGAKVRHLRRTHEPRLSQPDLQERLRPYGVKWNARTMVLTEQGRREITGYELYALSRVFEVPVWYFYVPLPEHANLAISENGNWVPAWQLLADMVDVEVTQMPHHLALRLGVELGDRGEASSPAVRGLSEAVARARKRGPGFAL